MNIADKMEQIFREIEEKSGKPMIPIGENGRFEMFAILTPEDPRYKVMSKGLGLNERGAEKSNIIIFNGKGYVVPQNMFGQNSIINTQGLIDSIYGAYLGGN